MRPALGWMKEPRMGRLDGKRALISGTGGGIGRATALLCAREGAHVVGCDLNPETAAETVELARAGGGRMDAVAPVDLATEEGARRWVQDAVPLAGGVDILVNNASAIRFGPIDTLSFADWSFTIRHELDTVFLVTRAAWPHLVAAGGGSIVNVASISATRGAFFMPQNAHGAAKGGVLALTYQLVVEGGPHGIRVNAVSPAMTETPHTAPMLRDPPGPAASIAARAPLGRWGQPEDVANAILFLACDESSHVSGANIPVDGGSAGVGGRARGSPGECFCAATRVTSRRAPAVSSTRAARTGFRPRCCWPKTTPTWWPASRW